MEYVAQDVRHSARSLAKSRLFSFTVIFCLTLSVGAVSSIYSVLNAVVLNAFPFNEPENLIDIQLVSRQDFQIDDQSDFTFTMPQRAIDPFLAIDHQQPYAWKADRGFAITDVETAFSLFGCVVSGNFFELVGPEVYLGRLFTPEDKDKSLVILSYRQWMSNFGMDANIIGTQLTVDGVRHTIVGVLQQDHQYPAFADLYVPERTFVREGSVYQSRDSYNLIGRLVPGQTVEQMNDELLALSDQFIEVDGGLFGLYKLYGIDAPTLLARGGQIGNTVKLLMVSVLALLLIASANVANLMLSRMQQQEQELSLRAALGARRGRLVRRLLIESGLLALVSSLLGVLLAYLILPIIVSQLDGLVANPERIRIGVGVLLFSVLTAIVTTLLVSLAPLFRVLTTDLAGILRAGGNKGMMGGGSHLRQVLVTAEAALTFLLLVGAGLMIKSFDQLQSVDMGLTEENLSTFILHPPASRASGHDQAMQFYAEAARELTALPGVQAAGYTHALPINDRTTGFSMTIEEFPPEDPAQILEPAPVGEIVSPNYLEVLDADLVEGRYLNEQDIKDGAEVVVISENMARFYWPNESAIGKRIKQGVYAGSERPWWTIVGVVEDIRSTPLNPAPHRFYRSTSQHELSRNFSDMRLAVRVEEQAGSAISQMQLAISRLSKDAVVSNERTMLERIARVTRTQQMAMNIVLSFGLIGLVLAVAGIFGVFSYNVQQRFREIGLRMVLGAKPYRVFLLVLKSALGLGVLGLSIGLVLTLSVKDRIESYLFEVSALDPEVYVGVTLLLLLAIAVAAFEPARRATRMDPVETLRQN